MLSVTSAWGWVLLMVVCVISAEQYSNEWAVEVEGGEEVAKEIARRNGFQFKGEVVPDTGIYLFAHNRISKRSTEQSHDHHRVLREEPQVRWLEQQLIKTRVKRDYMSSSYNSRRPSRPFKSLSYLNDPRWPQMWYLNRGQNLDMNVEGAWKAGVTGKGVVVTILDDGLEKNHPDLQHNYDPNASYDVNEHDADPQPRYDLINSNKHGTRCAGEVAADANNSICAVGVAWNAGVGGVRMLDGDVTDAVEARSLSLNNQHIDIYSASWGPDDDGKTVDGPGSLATKAFLAGITKGRRGYGNIFVWASGNGGRDYDNCNCDGYTNSIWTLSISSATEHGDVPWYSEACSSTLATTYSSGSPGEKQIVTTDLHHECTVSHTGTSASAPLAAGICALALEANPKMTWRDMQHIVVRTARPENLNAPDWATNGVGRNVSHSFGYGLMDASEMVRLARKWKTVPEQLHCEVSSPHTNKLIPAKSRVPLPLYVSGDRCNGIRFLEHVQAKVSLTALRRGDIEIILISPSGTHSTLLARRTFDSSGGGFESWPFMTVHNWGENPVGKWQLVIHNEGRYLGRARLREWSLVFFGTNQNPDPEKRKRPPTTTTTTPRTTTTTPPPTTTTTKALPPMLPPPSNKLQPLGQPDSHRKPVTLNDWGIALYGTNSDPNQDIPEDDADQVKTANARPETSGCGVGASGCRDCQEGLLLEGQTCVQQCSESYYEDTDVKQCFPCHYSCMKCSGANDYECTECFPDAVQEALNNWHYCHSKKIMTKFNELSSSHKYVVAAFVLLFLSVIFVVLGYTWLQCTKKRKGKYALLNGQTENATMPVMTVPYNDSSDGEA